MYDVRRKDKWSFLWREFAVLWVCAGGGDQEQGSLPRDPRWPYDPLPWPPDQGETCLSYVSGVLGDVVTHQGDSQTLGSLSAIFYHIIFGKLIAFHWTVGHVQVNDTIKVDIETGKPIDTIKFEIGNVCMISRGRNAGRVGVMQHIERCESCSLIFPYTISLFPILLNAYCTRTNLGLFISHLREIVHVAE